MFDSMELLRVSIGNPIHSIIWGQPMVIDSASHGLHSVTAPSIQCAFKRQARNRDLKSMLMQTAPKERQYFDGQIFSLMF